MFDLTRPEEFKHAVQASFDTTEPTYGTDCDFHWKFAQRLVERAPLRRGQTVLDLATGTAPAAILAASYVGAPGTILGLDISRGILNVAQQHLRAASLQTVHLIYGDAEHLPLNEASIDGLLCSSAIVWLPDIPRTLDRWRDVLCPGGWLAFSCFDGLARQTVIGLLSQLLQSYGQPLPELNARLNTPEKCIQVLKTAGFRDVHVDTANHQQLPATAEKSFEWAWSSRGRFSVTLLAADLEAVKQQYLQGFARLAADQENWNHDYEQFVVAYK